MEDGRIPRYKIIDRRSLLKYFIYQYLLARSNWRFSFDDNDICFHVEDQVTMKGTKRNVIRVDNSRRWKKKKEQVKNEFVLKLKATD